MTDGQGLGGDAEAPIAVFDSGVGGLTVLSAIWSLLPLESTVYLGDSARVPYGSRSAGTVVRYALNNARFLIEASKPKLLVVACNTATAVALEALRASLGIPVIGVIEPGAREAARRCPRGRIGVIGTRATVRSGAYRRALLEADAGLSVVEEACPLFVPLAEEGWHDDPIALIVAHRYLDPMVAGGLDALVLGCTHYPLLAAVIRQAVGPKIELVDSAHAMAQEALATLRRAGLLRAESATSTASTASTARHRLFVTDNPEAFEPVATRFLGRPPPSPELVEF